GAARVLRLTLRLRGRRVRLASFFLLQSPHLGEAAVRGEEVAEVAALDDLAVVEDEDLVGIDDRREAVRDDERGAVARDLGERGLNGFFGVRVEGRGRLVEDEDRRGLEKRARDG